VAIEHADSFARARKVAGVRTQFIINIRAESVEVIRSVLLCYERSDLERLRVLQQDHCTGNGSAVFIENRTNDRTSSWRATLSDDGWLSLSLRVTRGNTEETES